MRVGCILLVKETLIPFVRQKYYKYNNAGLVLFSIDFSVG